MRKTFNNANRMKKHLDDVINEIFDNLEDDHRSKCDSECDFESCQNISFRDKLKMAVDAGYWEADGSWLFNANNALEELIELSSYEEKTRYEQLNV